ncbi:hypothetical protein Cgig2_021238 [Carnegiea gigantea]|uniref:Peptidase S9 prolyl oligopeptidase catalytic domain-containing protein n=1 Tax=Carnegiea gigantea TaxID=171969 RepID=A0A9Q1QRA0_9CARY|nr:hypothetical protein Cgig2_021238 [Carnegiea gigantea]
MSTESWWLTGWPPLLGGGVTAAAGFRVMEENIGNVYWAAGELLTSMTVAVALTFWQVADLRLLRDETHKFESHDIDKLLLQFDLNYLFSLLTTGSTIAGDDKACFERSPINFVDKFSCPIILFQGLEDKVVPPDQARRIYKALKEKGVPVALVEYEGEQHGFRKAENIKFTLEQQMVFFARTIGKFKVADHITPLKIDNFD